MRRIVYDAGLGVGVIASAHLDVVMCLLLSILPGPSKYPQIGVYGPKLRVFRVFRG